VAVYVSAVANGTARVLARKGIIASARCVQRAHLRGMRVASAPLPYLACAAVGAPRRVLKQGNSVARQAGKAKHQKRGGWAGLLVGAPRAIAEMTAGDAPAGSYSDLHYSVLHIQYLALTCSLPQQSRQGETRRAQARRNSISSFDSYVALQHRR
jgi:hypothetical protein